MPIILIVLIALPLWIAFSALANYCLKKSMSQSNREIEQQQKFSRMKRNGRLKVRTHYALN